MPSERLSTMRDDWFAYIFGALALFLIVFGVVRFVVVASDCWPEGQVVKVIEWGDGLACVDTNESGR